LDLSALGPPFDQLRLFELVPFICDFVLEDVALLDVRFARRDLVEADGLAVLVALDVHQAGDANVLVLRQLFKNGLVHLEDDKVLAPEL
jgi:hypothetical protein